MTNEYEPELGQAIFGQPYQRYEASALCVAALMAIDEELCRVMWNRDQEQYNSPFDNTGQSFANDEFTVAAYSWDESKEQLYNFKWREVEISWYKDLSRGTTCNLCLTNDRIAEMLEACLASLRKIDDIACEISQDKVV